MSDDSTPRTEMTPPADPVARLGDAPPPDEMLSHTRQRRLCAPPIDIFESEDGLVLRADLPGVTAEGLEVQVQDNKLTLFGRVTTTVPEGARLLHQEYDVCDFLRSFILSDEVDHDRIEAKLTSGVLQVILPQADRPHPRRIPVRTD